MQELDEGLDTFCKWVSSPDFHGNNAVSNVPPFDQILKTNVCWANE